jgi:hypothetical protein
MKKAIDLNGSEVEVSIDTPVRTKNGVHYLLSINDEKEVKARDDAFTIAVKERKANEYKEKRQAEYGTPAEQIEFITEFGLEAWQAKVATIKATYPKGE